jgi:hypothetical protein
MEVTKWLKPPVSVSRIVAVEIEQFIAVRGQ